MTELIDVMAYLLKNYPYKNELSNARLTKMVYLSDWKYALRYGKQITSIQWRFNNYGPFVRDIQQTAEENPIVFEIQETVNLYDNKKVLIKLKDKNYDEKLSVEEKEILDFVIDSTKLLNWDKFIQLVYSTYPILMSPKQSDLNLVALARKRNTEKELVEKFSEIPPIKSSC